MAAVVSGPFLGRIRHLRQPAGTLCFLDLSQFGIPLATAIITTMQPFQHVTGSLLSILLTFSTMGWEGMASESSDTKRAETKRFAGLTVLDWHEQIKNIDPRVAPEAAVIEALVQIVADDDIAGVDREPFAAFLARIGEPARRVVPLLAMLIEDRTRRDYLWASRALALMGEPARDATPELIDLLFDEAVPVGYRQSTVEALARIGTAHPEAIPALLRLLRTTASGRTSAVDAAFLRQLAADSIYIVGPEAGAAAPLLVRIIRNPREPESVRRSALVAVGALRERGASAVNALMEELAHGRSPALRDTAAQALVNVGPAGDRALIFFSQHQDAEIRWRIAASLSTRDPGQFAPALKQLLPSLMTDPNGLVRINAAETSFTLFGKSKEVVDVAVTSLLDGERRVRIRGKNLLLAASPLELSTIARLRELEKKTQGSIRQGVAATRKHLRSQE